MNELWRTIALIYVDDGQYYTVSRQASNHGSYASFWFYFPILRSVCTADLCGMMWQHQSHSLLRTARFVVLEKGAWLSMIFPRSFELYLHFSHHHSQPCMYLNECKGWMLNWARMLIALIIKYNWIKNSSYKGKYFIWKTGSWVLLLISLFWIGRKYNLDFHGFLFLYP